LRLSMDYRPFFSNLVNSTSGTVISPDGERAGCTLSRWIRLSIVNESTPRAAAAWLRLNCLGSGAVTLAVDG